jgi:hypothetical protein
LRKLAQKSPFPCDPLTVATKGFSARNLDCERVRELPASPD